MDNEFITASQSSNIDDEKIKSLTTITTIVYALQAASFFIGITFLVALIINYVKKADVQGTWLESHFRWQIRTFWFSLLWLVIGLITTLIIIGYLLILINLVWIIYRIVKGWLELKSGKEMYIKS